MCLSIYGTYLLIADPYLLYLSGLLWYTGWYTFIDPWGESSKVPNSVSSRDAEPHFRVINFFNLVYMCINYY